MTNPGARNEGTVPAGFEGSASYVATGELRARRERGRHARPPAARQGRARHRQDAARRGGRARARRAAASSGTSSPPRKAQHGLYEYDAVSRLRDSQLGDERVTDIANYIVPGMLWQAPSTASAARCC